MVKKTGEETGTETLDTGTKELETGTETATTPTAEQQVETLQAQIKAETDAREKAEKSEQGLRGSLKEKDTKIREQADIQSQVDELKELQKMGFALMADQGRIPEEGIDPEKGRELSKVFDTKVNELEAKRKQRNIETANREYAVTAQAVYAKGQDAFKDDPASLSMVAMNLDAGRTDLAEALIAKVVKTTDTKGDKAESEEELKEKWVEEGKRLAKEESGGLTTDNNSPSGAGGSLTIEQLEKMSPEEKRARSKEIAELPLIIEE